MSKKETEKLKEVGDEVFRERERVMMVKEDQDAWLMREKEQLSEERDLVH